MTKHPSQPDRHRWRTIREWAIVILLALAVVAFAAFIAWLIPPPARGVEVPPPSVSVRSAATRRGPAASPSAPKPAPRPERPAPQDPLRPLFDALLMEESKGDDYAIGDGGRSLGPYQCTRAAWKDGCEWGGVDWDYDTFVWSRWHCEWVMIWYWERHECVNDEERARAWNGGPWGPQKESTLAYWHRVRAMMESGKDKR